ncbi:MAG: hypothetical protein DME34_03020 [Verrucomicrobia bacterium]|nr:MAG: hypothetical protein DME34_03020 [Verrucomicrobiota bacterium]
MSAVLPNAARPPPAGAEGEGCLQPRGPSFQPRRARAGRGNEAAAELAALRVAGEVASRPPGEGAYRS